MKPLSDCRLYTFVDTAYLQGRAPEVVAKQLCDGSADLIQLRAKNSSPEEIRQIAEMILPATRAANFALVINDHLEIAREIGAEFCHLGQEDFFEAEHKHTSEIRNPKSELAFQLTHPRKRRTLRIGSSSSSFSSSSSVLQGISRARRIRVRVLFHTGSSVACRAEELFRLLRPESPSGTISDLPEFFHGELNATRPASFHRLQIWNCAEKIAIVETPHSGTNPAEFLFAARFPD